MKTIKTLMLLVAVLSAFALTSCNDSDSTRYLNGHVTIEGEYPNYTLYFREGYVAKMNPSSVSQMTGGKGFSAKRAYLTISFVDENVVYEYESGTTDKVKSITINNADLVGGNYITTLNVMPYENAEQKNLTVADSIFSIDKVEDFWIHRQYLNLVVSAPYSVSSSAYVYPTMNLTYKQSDIKENAITMTLLYNRHTKKDVSSQTGSFITAYPIGSIVNYVPGNDSITVTVKTEGQPDKVTKIGRKYQ